MTGKPGRVVRRLRTLALRTLSALAASSCQASSSGSEGDVLLIWPAGAPGSEARQAEAESSGDWWVANVHRPSLTVVRPVARASGAAVVILPGGGHERLVYGPEGLAPARLLASHGLTAFVLKYRLAHEQGSPYTVEQHALADVRQALRVVRHRAKEYGVDPNRVGVMGWSAGGELAALCSYAPESPPAGTADPLRNHSARPSFQVLIYPGPAGLPEALPPDPPPMFVVAANDDRMTAPVVTRLLTLHQEADSPIEVHLYERGGHGFNLGGRSESIAIQHWPERLLEWLALRDLVR